MKLFNNKKCKIIIQLIIVILPLFLRYIQIVFNQQVWNSEYIKIENYLKKCSSPDIFDCNLIKISNFPKISIITPLYNTGKFVSRLIRSIQLQKIQDFEIIIDFN